MNSTTTLRCHPMRLALLAALAATSLAHAQNQAPPAPPTDTAAAVTTTPALRYASVFSQYQAFNEQPVTPWRQTNEVVQAIGGWRAYAQEARPADASEPTPAVAPSADPHAGHRQNQGKQP